VTGGSRGLGRNTAINAASGFDVIITYHSNKDAAAEVVSEIEVSGEGGRHTTDTGDIASFDAFAHSRSELGQLGRRTSMLLSTTRGLGSMPHLRRPQKSSLIVLLRFTSRACSS
jgi:NAD(P)-dependent dehydrogenase (short-subunit alcohol dehydrogenase family)